MRRSRRFAHTLAEMAGDISDGRLDFAMMRDSPQAGGARGTKCFALRIYDLLMPRFGFLCTGIDKE